MSTRSQTSLAARRIVRKSAWLPAIWMTGAVLAEWLDGSLLVVAILPVAAWLLFVLFTLYFFRDPTPCPPSNPDAILAPAHGRVDCVDETFEPDFMGGACRRISIFLSVFDVHVQNAPLAGRIAFLRHQPGQFLSALKTESAQCNENVLIGIKSSERKGERIAVRQIAGLIARRIVTWVNVGDAVERGQGFGLIQFGSRCDLYLPLSARITIQLGSRVVAGETVVATRLKAESGKSGLVVPNSSQS